MLTSKKPTLECKNTNDKFTVNTSNGNGALTYPVAMLTGDEAVYAGGVIGTTNKEYYLYIGKESLTISPTYYNSPSGSVARIGGSGFILVDSNLSATGKVVRPAISLAPGSEFINGDGSVDLPYVVE